MRKMLDSTKSFSLPSKNSYSNISSLHIVYIIIQSIISLKIPPFNVFTIYSEFSSAVCLVSSFGFFFTCLLYQISSLWNDYSVSSCHGNAYKSIKVSSYVCESFPQAMQITFQLKGPTGSRIQEKK